MTIYFNDSNEMEKILGINDSNLAYLEFLLSGQITTRGNQMTFSPDSGKFSSYIARMSFTWNGLPKETVRRIR